MRVTDLWPQGTRIVEIGATDGELGHHLVHIGYNAYLAVVRDSNRRSAYLQHDARLTGHVAVESSRRVVSHNNAEVLILHGPYRFQLARFRAVRHAKFVAWRLRPTLMCGLALVIAIAQSFVGRLGWPRIVWCDVLPLSRKRRRVPLIVCGVRRSRPHDGARRFIPYRLGTADFFRCLQQRGVQYAVLRWFETLPDVAPGEDLDLLVADHDLETVRAVLDAGPGIQPVDLYSVTGLPGADFQSMPYYPPHLAEELLARAVVHRGQYRVPAPREHFLSLAYHALYHKGGPSGLPRDAESTPTKCGDHDYVATLQKLATSAGFNSPITLAALDVLLDSVGWRPPHDLLVRLSRRNRWVRSLLAKCNPTPNDDDRIAVFLVREQALARGGVARVTQLLAQRGFEIVATEEFDPLQIARIARTIRGGNWGRGPWPISGGPPVAAIAVYDPAPIAPSRRQRRRFPFLANARLLCKEELRECFNSGLPAEQHCNVIHSSDSGREALDYLRITMPDRLEDILTRTNAPRERRAA
jgi:hypothetical protein